MSKFRVGQLVESGAGRVGAIIAVRDDAAEPTYHVFVNGRSEPFFESQLSAAGLEAKSGAASADELKCSRLYVKPIAARVVDAVQQGPAASSREKTGLSSGMVPINFQSSTVH